MSLFVAFEGPDASGKDTQLAMVQEKMREEGIKHQVVQDPTPGPIRDLLLHQEMSDSARLALHLAARSELFFKEILPALNQGVVVLSSRYILSTLVYQGLVFSYKEIMDAHRILNINIVPDLNLIYLPEEPLRPSINRADDFCLDNWKEITSRYFQYATNGFYRSKIIKVDGDSKSVFIKTWENIKLCFQARA